MCLYLDIGTYKEVIKGGQEKEMATHSSVLA